MSNYGGRELAASFRTVRLNTVRIAEEVPAESYGFRPTESSRTIGQTLAHMVFAPGVYSHAHQQGVDDIRNVNFGALVGTAMGEEAKLQDKDAIIDALRTRGEEMATYLEGLSDEFLGQRVAMPPGAEPSSKSRLEMLLSIKEHEMHHRGQLMVFQRMLGLTPHLTRQAQERMAQRQAAAPSSGR